MNTKTKICSKCNIPIGGNSRSGLCGACSKQKWAEDNRQKSNDIKKSYTLRHPEKRRESVYKDNNGKGRTRKMKWYDNFWFNGRRKVLLKIHPYCCRCGGVNMLHVHHRDGNGLTSSYQNNNWSNLIVLYFPCHMKVHQKKESPYYVGK